jgi:hypothetical protein
MASAAVLEQQTDDFAPPESAAPATAPRNPGGRPKGYKPFNNEVTPEDFFATLNAIDDADWPKSLVYVWRRDPFTDSTNGGREPKYIDVINRAVTERNIKEEQGSGTYKLQLNTNDKYVAHTILTIEDINFPPHVPPGDWFNNPRNKKWAQWRPLVEKWWKEKLAVVAGPAAQAPASDGAALHELTRLVSQLANNNGKSAEGEKLSAALIQWALQQTADERKFEREADSPGKLAELIRAVRELSPPPAAGGDPQQTTLITFLLDEVKSMREQTNMLLTKMFDMKTESVKQPGPLDQMKQMTEIMSTVSQFIQPAATREPWQEVATELGPKILSLGENIVTAVAMNNRVKANAAPPPPARPNPPQASIPVQAQPVTSAVPAPEAPPSDPAILPPGEPEMDSMQRSMLINVAQLAAQALNLSLTGEQFAEQMLYKFGQMVYDQFITNVPKDQLLTLVKSIPEAWSALQPFESQLPEFIESFYSLPDQGDDDDPKSISEPEPKPVKVPKAKKSK